MHVLLFLYVVLLLLGRKLQQGSSFVLHANNRKVASRNTNGSKRSSKFQHQKPLTFANSAQRDTTSEETWSSDPLPEQRNDHLDAVVCGGGPAGLLSAIMLAQRFPCQQIHLFEASSSPPPSLQDDTVWCDFARFYTLGVFGRGKRALQHFGAWDPVAQISQELVGTQAWRTNDTSIDAPVNLFMNSRREPIYALPRDKLVSALYQHIQEKYANQIQCHLGHSVCPVDFRSLSRKPNATVLLEVKSENGCRNITTDFLIGADGAARTVANRMEEVERAEWQKKGLIGRLLAGRYFRVKRFPDTNPRVYKTIPIQLPPDWRQDIGYSASNGDRRFSIVSLPANTKGGLCAVLLMKDDDPLANSNTDPKELRALLDSYVPVFSKLMADDVVAAVAQKPTSSLPFFRYAGPRLHIERAVILGDACHSVKPYNGLGVNSAFEDVRILSDALEETEVSSTVDSANLEAALREFSRLRAKDCKAVVELSRAGDRPGKVGFLSYLIPLLVDAAFHKAMPAVFEPPIPGLIHDERYRFHQVVHRKRWERLAQISILATLASLSIRALKLFIYQVSATMGRRQSTVTAVVFALPVLGVPLTRKFLSYSKG